MNKRERILAAIGRKKVDRIPTDIWATSEVWDKLRQYFGSDDEARTALHIDGFAYLMPAYTGPSLPELSDGEAYDCWSYWGTRNRLVDYGTGSYHEQYLYTLANGVHSLFRPGNSCG